LINSVLSCGCFNVADKGGPAKKPLGGSVCVGGLKARAPVQRPLSQHASLGGKPNPLREGKQADDSDSEDNDGDEEEEDDAGDEDEDDEDEDDDEPAAEEDEDFLLDESDAEQSDSDEDDRPSRRRKRASGGSTHSDRSSSSASSKGRGRGRSSADSGDARTVRAAKARAPPRRRGAASANHGEGYSAVTGAQPADFDVSAIDESLALALASGTGADNSAGASLHDGPLVAYNGGTNQQRRSGALADELVDVLNSATLKQLRALHTIGQKRAELICQRRAMQPFASVRLNARAHAHLLMASSILDYLNQQMAETVFSFAHHPNHFCISRPSFAHRVQLSDLTSVGMGEKQIDIFIERNTLNKAPPMAETPFEMLVA
jgi:hypothetical protein